MRFRLSYFNWDAAIGKILTTNNLHKRGFVIVDWCCLCKSDGESVSHLLLHCPTVSEMWASLFCIVGLAWLCQVQLKLCWSLGSLWVCKSLEGSSGLSYVVHLGGT